MLILFAVAELAIAIVLGLIIWWLIGISQSLRSDANRLRRVARDLGDLAELTAEPGRHAAQAEPGRHAASPPADLGSYAGFDLNGWHDPASS